MASAKPKNNPAKSNNQGRPQPPAWQRPPVRRSTQNSRSFIQRWLRRHLLSPAIGLVGGLLAVWLLPFAKSAVFGILRNSAGFQQIVADPREPAAFRQTVAVLTNDAVTFGLWGALVSLVLIWISEVSRGRRAPRVVPALISIGLGGVGAGISLLLVESLVLAVAPAWTASASAAWAFQYIGWLTVGACIGTGFGFAAPGMWISRGAAAGAAAGLVSALACTVLIFAGFKVLGYPHFALAGATFCALLSVTETWRVRWRVRVVQDSNLSVTVPIGPRFVTIGSGAQETVRVRGAATRVLGIRVRADKVEVKYFSGTQGLTRLQEDRFQIGTASVTIEQLSKYP